jgi:hypothetical protein
MNDSTKSSAGPAKQDAKGEQPERKETFDRIPFGGRRKRLYVDESKKDPGYAYYWFKDEGDNLYSAGAAAWSAVSFDDAGRRPPVDCKGKDPCYAHGGVGEAGRPYNMFYMKKPIELWKEDKAVQGLLADASDEAIFRKEFEEGNYGTHSVQSKNEE